MKEKGNGNGRPLLEVQDIYSGYTLDFDILKGVSMHVKPGEIVWWKAEKL